MSPTDVLNWVSIYLATGICCALAVTLTTLTVGYDMIRDRFWAEAWTPRSLMLFGPRTWWRWQRRYFLSTPVTLSIVGGFAASLNW